MSSFKVKPGYLPSTILVPRSKSHANRALILAALKSGPTEIINLPNAEDVGNLVSSLKQIGLHIEEASTLRILNSFPDCERSNSSNPVEVRVGEGGTTARFLAGMLLLGKLPYVLVMDGSLASRPWQEFIDIANELGAKAELIGNRLYVCGPVQVLEDLEVDCSRTTQFASSFCMALSAIGIGVKPKRLHASNSYWMVTNEMVEHFKSHLIYEVPMDWSSASYALAFGALKQEIFFPGFHNDLLQADAKFFNVLEQVLALRETTNGICVHPYIKNVSIDMDVSDCLDLVPTLAFFLSHINGTHRLRNIVNLIYKESNRLNGIISLLTIFSRSAINEGEDLVIVGKNDFSIPWQNLKLSPDHRMVMVGALFCRAHNGGEVAPSESVNKSYPEFFKLFDS